MDLDNNNKPPLPKGWVWVRLGEVLIHISNGISEKQNKDGKGIPVSRIETISKGTFDLEKVGYLEGLSLETIEKYKLLPGDILFSNINSDLHLGKTAIFDFKNIIVLHGMNLLLLRTNNEFLYPRWLNYLFNHYRFSGIFISIAQHAVNQSSINQSKLKNLQIPLPPLPEQHRIVAKIEELFTKLDAGVQALQKIKAQIKRYRQAVLKYAFEGKLTAEWRATAYHDIPLEPASALLERIKNVRANLRVRPNPGQNEQTHRSAPTENGQTHRSASTENGQTHRSASTENGQTHRSASTENGQTHRSAPTEDLLELPEGWVWVRLGEICLEPQYGWTTSAVSKGDIHLLRTTDITSGKIDWETVPYCKDVPPIIEKYLLKDGDIVISRAGSVGYSLLIKKPKEAVFASYLIRFKPLINEQFLSYFLKSSFYWESISEKSIGIALPNVNATKLKQILLPLPPLAEQHKIVEEIEWRFSIADSVEKIVDQSLKQAERLRQSILKRAFEGKLVPQDPTDEPAEKLLERIKSVGAIHESPKKTNRPKITNRPKFMNCPDGKKIKNDI